MYVCNYELPISIFHPSIHTPLHLSVNGLPKQADAKTNPFSRFSNKNPMQVTADTEKTQHVGIA